MCFGYRQIMDSTDWIPSSKYVKVFTEFKDNNHIAKSDDNENLHHKRQWMPLLLSTRTTKFSENRDSSNSIQTIYCPITIDANDVLWIFTSDNDTRSYQVKKQIII